MIEITDIIREAVAENENNVFYWDSVNDNGYHIHIFNNGSFVCFKQTRTMAKVITAEEFESAVNYKCYGHSICEESYYESFGVKWIN